MCLVTHTSGISGPPGVTAHAGCVVRAAALALTYKLTPLRA